MTTVAPSFDPLPSGRLEQEFVDAKPALTDAEALIEAHRCLFCHDAPCITACPTGIDIPAFIKKIATGNIRGSAKTIFSVNMTGATTARVCPVEELCAGACVYNDLNDKPIQIGKLQRYATSLALRKEANGGTPLFTPLPGTGKSVALIGAGPASLACAAHLALAGVTPVIYEKSDRPGGLNTTGIAPYKLMADDALREVEWILSHGVTLKTGVELGRDIEFAQLLEEHDAPEGIVTEARKQLGMTLSRTGDLKESAQELTAVLDLYEAEGDVYNIAHASMELGASLGLLGRLPEAAGYLERSRQLWSQLGNEHMLVQTLVNLGMIYYLQGDFVRAAEIYEQGREHVRVTSNLQKEVYLTTSLADIQRDMGEHQTALHAYKDVLDDAWSIGDAYICVYIMDAIANTHRLMGDLVQAESWAGRASAEAEKTEGDLEQGICLVTKGLIQRQQGELKEAIEYLEKAVPYLREKDARRELAAAYFHVAGAYFSLKKKRVALEYLEKVAELVKDLGYDHFLLVEAARNPLLVQYGAANKAADGYYARMKKLMKSAPSAEGESEDGVATDEATLTAFGFGHARVEYNGQEITDLEWRSEKSREMFFFFLCNRRGLRKEEIVAVLWPDMPEEKTTSAFHSSMYRLRKALYTDIISKESGRYQLDPSGDFAFDVEQFQAALAAADDPQAADEALKQMERAESLYKGQFAPEFYSEWAETLRWQLEEQYMSLLGSLSTAYNEAGEFKKSADICQKIVELDEFNEAAWYRLMSNYIQAQQTEAAKYCYNRYIQIVSEDEDVAADVADFDDLVKEITAGAPKRA
ncbi:MAG: tetratricopeptide repeat protein [Chloroflexi bacterium]|nr:tetratricopeptide repeat protein [Chloroflexota bacterium]